MKTYTEHIFEELVQDNSTEAKLRRYLERRRREHEEREKNRPRPESKNELQDMIIAAIEKNGPEADLNYIDTSEIEDMSNLFNSYHDGVDENKDKLLQSFNGDISDWDVSSVDNMNCMFYNADYFNQNISDWDVSSVEDMSYMFYNATSFNQNISGWKVGSVSSMYSMFYNAENFNQNISGWDVGSAWNMTCMFNGATSFNQDLSGWDVTGKYTEDMFNECPIEDKNKPKGLE